MYLGSWKIDDTLVFPANTHRFDTGVATDADSVPTYRVYEDETATPILTGSMALLDSTNTAGFYSEQITLSAANGLEKGKSYTIYITATVNSVEGTMSHTFQMEAEVDANVVSDKTGYSLSQSFPTNFASMGIEADGHVHADVKEWVGTTVTLSATTSLPETDAKSISDNAAAADNVQANIGNLDAPVSTVDTVVDAIKAKTDSLTFTVAGNVDSNLQTIDGSALDTTSAQIGANVVQISGSASAADNLELNTEATLNGTASGTPATNSMVSDITVTVDDQFKGRIIIFQSDTTTAALRNQATDITSATAATNTLGFTALTTAPSSGDTFIIV